MARARSAQRTTRPSFERMISPASSSTRKCFMKPGRDIPCGFASSVTGSLPPRKDASTARRVESARAAKTVSSALFR